jgi:hypothetical protein
LEEWVVMAALAAGVEMAAVAAAALGLTLVVLWIPAVITDLCTVGRPEMVAMVAAEAEVAMVAMAGLAYLALP